MNETTTAPVFLACGHAAHATHGNEHDGLPPHHPTCAIHMGARSANHPDLIVPQCRVIEKPSLDGRLALCNYKTGRRGEKHEPVPSSWLLAFFEYKPDGPFDEFYCGCWGWD